MTDVGDARPGETQSERRTAVVCITTYRRPKGLARAVDAVAAMRVPAGWSIDLVVVDNDPDGSGRAVVEAAACRGIAVRYVVEQERGIPHARNRAVAEAGDAEWLVFIDDDEAPAPDWFERVVETQQISDADVAIGPSVPEFEHEPPAWIRRGRFFERNGAPGGAGLGSVIPYWYARTSGVLLRTTAYAPLGPRPFDERLVASGGSDRAFFAELASRGARIVWAPDAIVTETVPASRATLRWLLRRHFRIGNQRSRALLEDGARAGRRAARIARGSTDVVRGIVLAAMRGPTERRVQALQRAACGAGLAVGAAGYLYDEYRTTHGT